MNKEQNWNRIKPYDSNDRDGQGWGRASAGDIVRP